MLSINTLRAPQGAKKRKKRVGCGPGSGHGKTSTRGHKGQGQHAGSKTYVGFTGGNVPLFRHIPKRGFTNKFRKEIQVVNLKDINARFKENQVVTRKSLRKKGLIKKISVPVKVLGTGNIDKKLVFKVDKISSKALKKIEASGAEVKKQ